MSRPKIPEKVRYLLWAKSAGRCEFNGCNEHLWRDGLTQIEMDFGDVAHIIGDSPRGPRGDLVRSKTYRSNVSNIMLLCLKHHRMIDQNTELYSEKELRDMKLAHEQRIEILTAINPNNTSQVILYSGKVGTIPRKIDYREACLAMYPSWYPASFLPIDLSVQNSAFEDYEEDYWRYEATNLERNFNEKVKPHLTPEKGSCHFSVFAFAPQPLLIKLGTLLSDIYPAEVYQLHREPPTWQWLDEAERLEFAVTEPSSSNPVVALKIGLSASINSRRVSEVLLGQPFSEWEISIANPNNDFLKSRWQLQIFRQEFRKVLNRIKAKHGENAVIHIFPAVPVSIAVEIGRVRQPKADLPYVVYDQNNKKKKFIKALAIGGVDHE
jgi:hypothetical protein